MTTHTPTPAQEADQALIDRLHEIAHRDSAVAVTVRTDDLRALLSKLRAPVAEVQIGVSVTEQGATVCLMQPHANGSATVIYSNTHPPGDSLGRAALASAPVAPQACPTDVCQAGKADGVLCTNDECDRANGVRPASAPVAADARAEFARAEISFPMTIPSHRVYLAGPMTGHENHNFPAFHAAAERLRASGMEVVNPADHGLVSGLGWADYMRWDLVKLAGCHSVYVLPGWKKSKGASLEVSIAQALGMPVFTVDGAALGSAPVAGEATVYLDAGHLREVQAGNDMPVSASTEPGHGMVPYYAAPQASEAVRDAEDAERWRAFIGCARIRPLGSAGLEQPDPNNYAHMGLEIWTVYGRDYSPELLKKMDAESERGRRWLVMFADVARAALSAQPGAQKGCNCATCRPHSVEMRMILCETCGDKRCPHAADHRNECVGTGAQKGGSDA